MRSRRVVSSLLAACLGLFVGPVSAGASTRIYELFGGFTSSSPVPEAQYVSIFDLESKHTVAIVPIGRGMSGTVADRAIAVARDGTEVYAANEADGTVSVISSSSCLVVATLGPDIVGTGPVGIVVSPDGRRLYVLGNSALSIVDRASRTRTASVALGPGGTGGLAISNDGGQVFAGSIAGVRVIDTRTLAVRLIPLAGAKAGMAVAPDGRRLYVGVPDQSSMTVIDVQSGVLLAKSAAVAHSRWPYSRMARAPTRPAFPGCR